MSRKNSVQESTSTSDKPTMKDRAKHWGIVALLALVGIFVALYVFPLSWKNFITGIVNESLVAGFLLGTLIGGVFTILPIWLIIKGWQQRSNGSSSFMLFAGLVLLIPNLLTLWIYLRITQSANDFAQQMSSEAPGFGFGSLVGAILAVGFGIYLVNMFRQRDKAKEEAAEERARREAAEKANDTTRVVEHDSGSAPDVDITDARSSSTSSESSSTPPHP